MNIVWTQTKHCEPEYNVQVQVRPHDPQTWTKPNPGQFNHYHCLLLNFHQNSKRQSFTHVNLTKRVFHTRCDSFMAATFSSRKWWIRKKFWFEAGISNRNRVKIHLPQAWHLQHHLWEFQIYVYPKSGVQGVNPTFYTDKVTTTFSVTEHIQALSLFPCSTFPVHFSTFFFANVIQLVSDSEFSFV